MINYYVANARRQEARASFEAARKRFLGAQRIQAPELAALKSWLIFS